MTPINPKCFYPREGLELRKQQAQVWIRVAEENGKQDHPAAVIARTNLALIEEMLQ